MRISQYSVLVATAALAGSMLVAETNRMIAQERESVPANHSGEWHLNHETAETVIAWNVNAERALNQAAQERGQPNRARLETAMVQGAVYDAVNAIARTHSPYLGAPPARWWYSKDAAAATAAYRMLIALLPDQQSTLEPLYEESLAAIPDGPAKARGISVGEKAAETMLAAREDDARRTTAARHRHSAG